MCWKLQDAHVTTCHYKEFYFKLQIPRQCSIRLLRVHIGVLATFLLTHASLPRGQPLIQSNLIILLKRLPTRRSLRLVPAHEPDSLHDVLGLVLQQAPRRVVLDSIPNASEIPHSTFAPSQLLPTAVAEAGAAGTRHLLAAVDVLDDATAARALLVSQFRIQFSEFARCFGAVVAVRIALAQGAGPLPALASWARYLRATEPPLWDKGGACRVVTVCAPP